MPSISQNLNLVRQRIDAAAKNFNVSHHIRLLAVSKTKPAELLQQAYAAGQRDFGENYLQEALEKQQALAELEICWHFIGPIQSNKTRAISENFHWVHSVDRIKIARRLSAQRPEQLPALNICLQINLDREDSKSGFSLDELSEAAAIVAELPGLKLRGLMAIPQKQAGFEQQQASLARLQQALTQLQPQLSQTHAPLDTLSMGMSADLEAAIAAGSNMLRIGSDIFGQRDPAQ